MSDASVSPMQNAAEQLGVVRDRIIVGVADAVNSGVDATRQAQAKMGEGLGSLFGQGKAMARYGRDVVRARPLTTVAIVLAAGYLIAKLNSRD